MRYLVTLYDGVELLQACRFLGQRWKACCALCFPSYNHSWNLWLSWDNNVTSTGYVIWLNLLNNCDVKSKRWQGQSYLLKICDIEFLVPLIALLFNCFVVFWLMYTFEQDLFQRGSGAELQIFCHFRETRRTPWGRRPPLMSRRTLRAQTRSDCPWRAAAGPYVQF